MKHKFAGNTCRTVKFKASMQLCQVHNFTHYSASLCSFHACVKASISDCTKINRHFSCTICHLWPFKSPAKYACVGARLTRCCSVYSMPHLRCLLKGDKILSHTMHLKNNIFPHIMNDHLCYWHESMTYFSIPVAHFIGILSTPP